MMLPQDVDHEIYRMERQAEAVAIYLGQQAAHPTTRRMLQHKIREIEIYIRALREAQNDEEIQNQS